MTTSSPYTPPRPARKLNVALLLALAALATAGGLWLDSRASLDALQQTLTQKAGAASGVSKDVQARAEHADKTARENSARLAALEGKVGDFAGQAAALNSLYQEQTRNREDWMLAEIEHALNLAGQQLQLAGNVAAASSTLEAIDARLAKLDRPQFIPLRKALGQDLGQLKSAPAVDVVGLTVKLDRLAAEIDALPLVIDHARQQADTPAPSHQGVPAWQRLGEQLLDDIGQLIRVRRMDKPEALLLSPEQAFLLRENVKLRLLGARVAVLQRQDAPFRTDLSASERYVRGYFDTQAPAVGVWLAALNEIKTTQLSVRVPDISASLRAVRALQGRPQE
ncbi:MAG: uroporphyrinogen-III C-methyltransferase [Rivihabitans pingtungensis]|jgi:uroporphyrin-3 C-methyltransferase